MNIIRVCSPLIFLLTLVSLIGSVSSLTAQENLPVEVVGNVDFRSKLAPHGWNAVFVDIRANKNISKEAINSQYVDNVKLIFTAGYKLLRGPKKFSYYQTEVSIATLEQGKTKRLAFFMPADIVERDDLDREPDFWTVDFEVNGELLGMEKNRTSSSIKDAKTLEQFKSAYGSEIIATQGIMVPAHLSPYGYGFGERDPAPVIWKTQP